MGILPSKQDINDSFRSAKNKVSSFYKNTIKPELKNTIKDSSDFILRKVDSHFNSDIDPKINPNIKLQYQRYHRDQYGRIINPQDNKRYYYFGSNKKKRRNRHKYYRQNPQIQSKEAYFDPSNPFQTQLVNLVKTTRTRLRELYSKNHFKDISALNNALNTERSAFENLFQRTFNIERYHVWFINEENFCQVPYGFLSNEIYDDKSIRIKLDDVVEKTNTSFRFKNGKGLGVILFLSFPIFLAEESTFSDREIAAAILHEIGHSFQHIITGFNAILTYQIWKYLLELTAYTNAIPDSQLSKDDRHLKRKINRFLKMIEQEQNGTIEALQKTGEKIVQRDSMRAHLRDINKSDDIGTLTHKSIDQKKLKEIAGIFDENKSDERTINTVHLHTSKDTLIRRIISILLLPFNILFNLIMYPFIKSSLINFYKPEIEKNRKFTVMEMSADSIATMYGFGPELASIVQKMQRLKPISKPVLFRKYSSIPILSVIGDYIELNRERMAIVSGYPPTKQRVMNIYATLSKELETNKDLSEEARAGIKHQMHDIVKVYNLYIDKDAIYSDIYRSFSIVGKSCLEEAARTDSDLEIYVLKPFRERQKAGYIPKV